MLAIVLNRLLSQSLTSIAAVFVVLVVSLLKVPDTDIVPAYTDRDEIPVKNTNDNITIMYFMIIL